MRARIAVLLLIPLATVSLASCESDDPTGPGRVGRQAEAGPVVSDRSVRIEGPTLITRKGTYTWIAVMDGEFDEGSYEWEVQWIDQNEPPVRYPDGILRLVVDPARGRLTIMLKDTSQGSRLVAQAEVQACEYGAGEDPTGIIPECERML